MALRFLAYGGTRFDERMRIGSWPSLAAGTLGDSYGLIPGKLAFGVGILASEPFLIIRSRVNIDGRGGYPYTLLLDPGIEVWRRYGWNAAHLISELSNEKAARVLWESPQEMTDCQLAVILEGLPAAPFAPAEASDSERFYQILAGSMTQQKPIVISPDDLALTARPEPSWVASLISVLPTAFRLGEGWLFGGGIAHAGVLGVRVILDDQNYSAPAVGREWLKAGARLVEDIKIVESRVPGALAELLEQPAWQWKQSPQQILEATSLLAHMLGPGDVPDEDFERLSNLGGDNPLVEVIHSVALEAALGGNNGIGPQKTSLILDAAFKGQRELKEDTLSQIEQPRLLEELRRRGYPPAPLPKTVALPIGLRLQAWTHLLREPGQKAPALFKQALDELRGLAPEQLEAFVDTAIQETSDNDLAQWRDFPQAEAAAVPGKAYLSTLPRAAVLERSADDFVRSALRKRVRTQARPTDSPLALRNYLLFADDPKMLELFGPTAIADGRAMIECVNTLLDLLAKDEEVAEPTFRELAVLPVRTGIPLHLKMKIAEALADFRDNPWTRFKVIDDLYHGRAVAQATPAPRTEKPYLDRELLDLFSSREVPDVDVPRLADLDKFLGGLSESTGRGICDYPFPFTDFDRRDRWRSELTNVDLREAAGYVSVMLALDFPGSYTVAPAEISESTLSRVVNELFVFDETPPNLKERIAAFQNWKESRTLQALLLELVRTKLDHPEQISRAWLQNLIVPEALVEMIPGEQLNVVQILATDENLFEGKFAGELVTAMKHPSAATRGLQRAVIEYLLSPKARALLDRWVVAFGRNEAQSFKRGLEKLLRRERAR